jgi:hypothetical protein
MRVKYLSVDIYRRYFQLILMWKTSTKTDLYAIMDNNNYNILIHETNGPCRDVQNIRSLSPRRQSSQCGCYHNSINTCFPYVRPADQSNCLGRAKRQRVPGRSVLRLNSPYETKSLLCDCFYSVLRLRSQPVQPRPMQTSSAAPGAGITFRVTSSR